ncbi:hypothetical protein [Mucilaginibacter terrenus]|uniref:hypothetical protein n=1 Tax=Mucilaginibacter terrenus TaxID=2482727 RepID=UPI0010589317|nr:hypothetical protein [Mucilaginibacter terrenus]
MENRYKEILWELLANPAENGQQHRQALERLVQDNPQSGLLQMMYARTGEPSDLAKASVYFTPSTLYKIINDPDSLLPVSRDRINKSLGSSEPAQSAALVTTEVIVEQEGTQEAPVSDEPVAAEESLIVTEAPAQEEVVPTEPAIEELPPALPEHVEEAVANDPEEQHYAEPVEEPYQEPAPLVSEPEEEESNPWDMSKLAEPVVEDETFSNTETMGHEGIWEATFHQPESVLEGEPTPTFSIPASSEFNIPTYDHSLSAYEMEAIGLNPVEPTELTVDYPVENVFHKQDEIDDEVYDEIVSIDEIGIAGLSNKFALDADEAAEQSSLVEEVPAETSTPQPFDPETERLIYGNIAATDYLSFDKKLDELRTGFAIVAEDADQAEPESPAQQPSEDEIEEPKSHQASTEEPKPTEPEPAVARYNDDTMPYSFLWWLDKTRKEHASVNQPYAEPVNKAAQAEATMQESKKASGDELQQQYFENIVNLTSVSSIGIVDPPKVEFDHNKKEDVIIERFIQTDPQIKPLSADKLDNENKAKKSSEDQDALVTETLARIYSDQMLYHKAIATYKKLMLKIPEKKLYFAAQIEQLEKKTN